MSNKLPKKQRKISFMKDLNKDWKQYTKNINTMLEEENYNIPNSKRAYIKRRRKGCDDSICEFIKDELDKLEKMIDDIMND